MPEEHSSKPVVSLGEVLPHLAQSRPPGDATQESSGGAEAPQNQLAEQSVVSRAEFNKVVGQRQAAKEKVRHLSTEVEQLLARFHAMPGEEELKVFQEWKDSQQKAGGIPAHQGQDVEAIADRVRQPLEARIEELRGRKDALKRRLTDLLRDQELRVAAARANAINPEQVVALLRDRVRITETDDGQYAPEFVDGSGQPAFVGSERVTETKRFVDQFLSMPENANLVRSTVTPGSGAKQSGGMAINTDLVPRTKVEFLALSPDQRRRVANRMTGRQRDVLLGKSSTDGGGYL